MVQKPTPVYELTFVDSYIEKNFPGSRIVYAEGMVKSTGWSNPQLLPRFSILNPPKNGVYEFDFVATAPYGSAGDKMTEVQADFRFDVSPDNFKEAIVYSATNHMSNNNPKALTRKNQKFTGTAHTFDEAWQAAIGKLHGHRGNPYDEGIITKITVGKGGFTNLQYYQGWLFRKGRYR